MRQRCLITTSSTSKNAVDVVLFNWKDLNQLRMNQYNRICPYYAKELMNEQEMLRAITDVRDWEVNSLGYYVAVCIIVNECYFGIVLCNLHDFLYDLGFSLHR